MINSLVSLLLSMSLSNSLYKYFYLLIYFFLNFSILLVFILNRVIVIENLSAEAIKAQIMSLKCTRIKSKNIPIGLY